MTSHGALEKFDASDDDRHGMCSDTGKDLSSPYLAVVASLEAGSRLVVEMTR